MHCDGVFGAAWCDVAEEWSVSYMQSKQVPAENKVFKWDWGE